MGIRPFAPLIKLLRDGRFVTGASYPVMVHERYIMSSSPIPRWDSPKFHQSEHLTILSAGREKRLYAVPPHTDVYPLEFDDVFFDVEDQTGRVCLRSDVVHKFMNEIPQDDGTAVYELSDSGYADKFVAAKLGEKPVIGDTYYDDEGTFYYDGYIKEN